VIPPGFDYAVASSVDDAIKLRNDGGDDARFLAGGHSLIPYMKLRLAAPSLLVDLRGVPDIEGIERSNGDYRIGALTRHVTLQNADLGLATAAAKLIADQQVRNRGTIGGSLAQADPASDLPTVLLACDGSVNVRGTNGERTVAAGDLFKGYLTTSLSPDELVTHVNLPALEGYGYSYLKFTRRAEDWAMVGVAALLKGGDTVEDVRVAFTHMGVTPVRATAVEEALRGQPKTAESIASAAEQAGEGMNPPTDLNATLDYKKHLARVLTRRALTEAAGL
jgi:aerobic carbon-monoxide dehydrogenase medium subunit